MQALGKLQDERASAVLARHLRDPELHDDAVAALRALGPKAHTEVMPYAFDGDPPHAASGQRTFDQLRHPPGGHRRRRCPAAESQHASRSVAGCGVRARTMPRRPRPSGPRGPRYS